MTPNAHLLPLVWPHPALQEAWESGVQTTNGATQPWIQALLYQLCRALDVRRATELGCWRGFTSAWLACAIAHNGGGSLTLADTNKVTLDTACARVATLSFSSVVVTPFLGGSLSYLEAIPKETQFVFLDDDKAEPARKLTLLKERCPGCYVALHDAELPEVLAATKASGGMILDIPPGDGSGSLGLVRL